uniref:tRNA 4-demethylwyosine synthase (AdoMet-dependent) n=1 Tax=Eutreptiella gymnastica TaxID=73025 RepID=A0A7S1NCE0_9EUGL|mmetsp:Transcript_150272/g.262589  ORF Transcript_150272/g.262589 Transcript_150272/m.262589 type:complete len:641 (+) Transcript_150272:88-2010(+)
MVEWCKLLLPLSLLGGIPLCNFLVHLLRRITSGGDQSKAIGSRTSTDRGITILYATQKGTAAQLAGRLAKRVEAKGVTPQVVDLAHYDPEDFPAEKFVAFIVATYEGGEGPVATHDFFRWLEEHSNDFRVPKNAFESLNYSILGLGNSVYADKGHYNLVALNLDRSLQKLSGQRILEVSLADEQDGLLEVCDAWIEDLTQIVVQYGNGKALQPVRKAPSAAVVEDSEEDGSDDDGFEDDIQSQGSNLMDMEDLGQAYGKKNKNAELLNPRLRQSLTKQGYQLIGSHSGVKLCRWTKAMLRGRGGCYKHTFYGIKSYQCMEMTPSLACANKCVFCWRHHSNPVTKEWRWKMDDPEFLVTESIDAHVRMINTMKGVPGVKPERLAEAYTPRHCALSLVGEPIIYPEINSFVRLLHERHISTFMVTNAQFPDRIDQLDPVTQLYVSIDAATKESLKAVDRPIFDDFWERFLACIDSLRRKGQRTVFRLTLVKDRNMEEMAEYCELVKRGQPDFIEVKGVTYCGENTASDLTIKNSPYHQEVVRFCEELCDGANLAMGDTYGLACEHEHSVCVLIANKKFFVDGQWHTWIDYDRFHELALGNKAFDATDYMEPTPGWAVFGADEKGFDPAEVRHVRKQKQKAST